LAEKQEKKEKRKKSYFCIFQKRFQPTPPPYSLDTWIKETNKNKIYFHDPVIDIRGQMAVT
jgi:hypothetical protein